MGSTILEYRFCADLRVLNNKVLTDNLFTGSVPANLALLERHNIYRALDMYNAFESCDLEPLSHDFCLRLAHCQENSLDTKGSPQDLATPRQLCHV